jgi:DEAD/DEAH box helicase domain-containing protein
LSIVRICPSSPFRPASFDLVSVSNLVHNAYETVESCQCDEGCLRCIYGAACKEANEVHSKLGAQIILRGLTGLAVNVDNVPYVSEGAFHNTIVEADAVQAVDPNLPIERD